MVKEVCASGQGFGACMLNSQGDKETNQHIYPIGTQVQIVDFDTLEDGLLGITVEGLSCFKILSISSQADGLRIGQCESVESWQMTNLKSLSPLDDKLKEIFAKYTELQALHSQPKFDDPLWVMYRWLELLPLNAEQKQAMLQQKDGIHALNFLTQLVE